MAFLKQGLLFFTIVSSIACDQEPIYNDDPLTNRDLHLQVHEKRSSIWPWHHRPENQESGIFNELPSAVIFLHVLPIQELQLQSQDVTNDRSKINLLKELATRQSIVQVKDQIHRMPSYKIPGQYTPLMPIPENDLFHDQIHRMSSYKIPGQYTPLMPIPENDLFHDQIHRMSSYKIPGQYTPLMPIPENDLFYDQIHRMSSHKIPQQETQKKLMMPDIISDLIKNQLQLQSQDVANDRSKEQQQVNKIQRPVNINMGLNTMLWSRQLNPQTPDKETEQHPEVNWDETTQQQSQDATTS